MPFGVLKLFFYRVANDLVDAFDHFKCNRTLMNHHSVVKIPNNNSHFNRKHEVEFGLIVTETGTVANEVKSVSCRFCSYYGRNEGLAGKRKRTNNLKFFRSPCGMKLT